jgi:hypothetical protein
MCNLRAGYCVSWTVWCIWLATVYCEQSGVSGWLLCIVNSLVYLAGYCVLWTVWCIWLATVYCEQSGVSGWLLCIVNSLVYLAGYCVSWTVWCIWPATVYCEQSGVSGWLLCIVNSVSAINQCSIIQSHSTSQLRCPEGSDPTWQNSGITFYIWWRVLRYNTTKCKVSQSNEHDRSQLCHCCGEGKVINKVDRDRQTDITMNTAGWGCRCKWTAQNGRTANAGDFRQNICKVTLWWT